MARLSPFARALALAALPFAASLNFTVDPILSGLTSDSTSDPMAGVMLMTETTTAMMDPTLTVYLTIRSSTASATATSYPPWANATSNSTPPFPIPANITASMAAGSASAMAPCYQPPANYTVVAHDTVEEIAAKFNISVDTLEAANSGKVMFWDLLENGTELMIPPMVSIPCSAWWPAGLPTTFSTAISLSQSNTASSVAPLVTPLANNTNMSSSLSSPTGPITAWTVESGDTGGAIATEVSEPFRAITSANPTVNWSAITPGQTIGIPPSPTALSQVTASVADRASNHAIGSSKPQVMYTQFNGNGTVSAGWPTMENWVSFDAMWSNLKNSIGRHCGTGVPDNSDDENDKLKNSILNTGALALLDPRFILAAVCQESNGCVRVVTTSLADTNPGLLQSFNGKGSCNHNGTFDNPCPITSIDQMMSDRVGAPVDGVTLVSALNQAAGMPNTEAAQAFYMAARFYNSGPGSLPANTTGDLGSEIFGATLCYASDIANRLQGWTNGKIGGSPCDLDKNRKTA